MEQTAEKKEGIKPVAYIGLILLAAVSGVLTALGFAVPEYTLSAILLWPLAAALQARVLVGARAGEGNRFLAGLPVALTVISVFFAGQADAIRLITAMLVVPLTTFCIALLQIKKLGGVFTSMGAAAVGIGAVYAIVCLPGIISGEGAFTTIQNLYAGYAAELKETVALLAGEALKETVADFAAQIDDLVAMVPDVTTGMIFLIGYCGGLGAVLLFFAFTAKRRETLGLAAPSRVCDWRVPGIIFRPVFIFYLIASVLYMFDVANAVSVYYVVSVSFTFLTAINGFATGEWLLERIRRKQPLFRALAYAVTAIAPMLVLSPLSTLGFVDCIFHMRERLAARIKQKE